MFHDSNYAINELHENSRAHHKVYKCFEVLGVEISRVSTVIMVQVHARGRSLKFDITGRLRDNGSKLH